LLLPSTMITKQFQVEPLCGTLRRRISPEQKTSNTVTF
jgi:hypothetical protein